MHTYTYDDLINVSGPRATSPELQSNDSLRESDAQNGTGSTWIGSPEWIRGVRGGGNLGIWNDQQKATIICKAIEFFIDQNQLSEDSKYPDFDESVMPEMRFLFDSIIDKRDKIKPLVLLKKIINSVTVHQNDEGDGKIIYDDLQARRFFDTNGVYSLKESDGAWQVFIDDEYRDARLSPDNIKVAERLQKKVKNGIEKSAFLIDLLSSIDKLPVAEKNYIELAVKNSEAEYWIPPRTEYVPEHLWEYFLQKRGEEGSKLSRNDLLSQQDIHIPKFSLHPHFSRQEHEMQALCKKAEANDLKAEELNSLTDDLLGFKRLLTPEMKTQFSIGLANISHHEATPSSCHELIYGRANAFKNTHDLPITARIGIASTFANIAKNTKDISLQSRINMSLVEMMNNEKEGIVNSCIMRGFGEILASRSTDGHLLRKRVEEFVFQKIADRGDLNGLYEALAYPVAVKACQEPSRMKEHIDLISNLVRFASDEEITSISNVFKKGPSGSPSTIHAAVTTLCDDLDEDSKKQNCFRKAGLLMDILKTEDSQGISVERFLSTFRKLTKDDTPACAVQMALKFPHAISNKNLDAITLQAAAETYSKFLQENREKHPASKVPLEFQPDSIFETCEIFLNHPCANQNTRYHAGVILKEITKMPPNFISDSSKKIVPILQSLDSHKVIDLSPIQKNQLMFASDHPSRTITPQVLNEISQLHLNTAWGQIQVGDRKTRQDWANEEYELAKGLAPEIGRAWGSFCEEYAWRPEEQSKVLQQNSADVARRVPGNLKKAAIVRLSEEAKEIKIAQELSPEIGGQWADFCDVSQNSPQQQKDALLKNKYHATTSYKVLDKIPHQLKELALGRLDPASQSPSQPPSRSSSLDDTQMAWLGRPDPRKPDPSRNLGR